MLKVFVFLLFLGIGRSAPLDLQGLLLKIDQLTAKNNQLTELSDQLTERVTALEIKKRSNLEGPIAFTATVVNTLEHLGDHQHIIFDHVITNIGDGYSPLHGHFTAPVRGAYAFFVVLTNTPGHSASAELQRNGQWIGKVLADDETTHWTTSTLAVTTQLEAGDQVWVQNEDKYSGQEQIDGNDGWTSFSGHLIQLN
ncbi:complement C1q-like protein 2 [Dreissena polymorpha]|uniref:C1q domain-containing protein n=1 Tax=Dreissena polymorpha TaxID=45954 RepID=A0A9D4BV33_DREPO|nr:complement C1q-like protein 2 [Dreissena polymorpha]KAH3710147.1 hypothetical protein DPMN_069615 [Dreissena polymorpha]